MLTRDQQYASLVYEQVKSTNYSKGGDNAKKYGSLAHKLPILIRKAGLMQTLAFVEARHKPAEMDDLQAKHPQYQLVVHLATTLKFADAETLVNTIRTAPIGEYMRYTLQVLEALLWYKRFAESVLDVKASDDADATEGGKTDAQ
jgi:CRISPR-associated protein Cmr5